MELIILGSSASYALPGEATSGYLVRNEKQSIVIDIGTGCLSNLFRWQDPADMEVLILSHLHVDHIADLYPLRLYLNFDRPEKKLTVYAPEGAAEKLGSVLSPKGKNIFERTIRFKTLKENSIKIGDFKVSFAKMVHDIDSFAVKVQSNDKSLVYSSDTVYNDKLVRFAKEADLLLTEATLNVPVEGVDHMTAQEAGKLASEAKVKKMIITHVWPTYKDSQTPLEAAKHFSGPIEVASVNEVYKV